MQSGELTHFDGRPPARTGGRDYPGPAALDRLYATRNGWIRIQARPSDLPVLRRAGLLPAGQEAGDPALAEMLAGAFGRRDRDELVGLLTELGVPAVAARQVPELADGEAAAAGLLHRHERAGRTPYFVPGRMAAFGRTPQTAALMAPGLGGHTRQILAEVGYRPERIDALIAAGDVVEGPPANVEP
jgi:crotonobetainyl-CoA:carnitine CoA-transferase CaiB-like acyl-CoA transferase